MSSTSKPLFLATLFIWNFAYSQGSTNELLFSDDFNDGTLSDLWTFPPTGLDVVGGRVRSTDNGRVLRTIDEFSGDIRVEFDVEKEGDRNHSCWDITVGFTRTNGAKGVLLFDHNRIDALAAGETNNGICAAEEFVTLPGAAPNRGHVTLTMQNETLTMQFDNVEGQSLSATSSIDVLSPYRLYINLAAHADSPRYIDNVQVFSLAGLPGDYNGNSTVEQADLDLVLLNWGSEATSVPDTWSNDLPEGTIDQNELDGVLLNWGNGSGLAAVSVPEPTSVLLAVVVFTAMLMQRQRFVVTRATD